MQIFRYLGNSKNYLKQNSLRILLLCVLVQVFTTLLFVAKAQDTNSVDIQVLTPFTQLKNSNVLSLVVRFDNNSSEAVEFNPELSIPEGWRLLIPLGTVNLAANSGQTIPFSIIVPPSSFAGDYSLGISLPISFIDRQENSFSVEVVAVEALQLMAVSQPDYVLDGSYTIEYLLINNGNEEQSYTLSAKDTLGFDMTLSPDSITLAPQERIALTLEVNVPEVEIQRSHAVTIIVNNTIDDDTGNAPIASLRTTVDVIPRTLSESLLWHYFPLKFSATTNYNMARANPLDSLLSSTNFSLSGSGKFFDDDPGNFSLTASVTGQFNSPTFYGEYRHPNYTVSGGKFSTSLGGLLGTTSSWGMSFGNDWTLYDTLTIDNKVLLNSVGDFGVAVSPTIYLNETTPIKFNAAILVPSVFGTGTDLDTVDSVALGSQSDWQTSQIDTTKLSDSVNLDSITPPATTTVSTATTASKTTRLGTSLNILPQDNRFSINASYILELGNDSRPAAGNFNLNGNLNFSNRNGTDSTNSDNSENTSTINRHRLSAKLNHTQSAYQGAIDESLGYGVTYYYFNSDLNLNFSSYVDLATNLTQSQHTQSYGANLRGTLGQLGQISWLVGSSFYTKYFSESESGFSIRVQATLPLSPDAWNNSSNNLSLNSYGVNTTYTTQSLTWEQTNKQDKDPTTGQVLSNTSLLKYQGNLFIPLGDSTSNNNNLRATLSSIYNIDQQSINQLRIGTYYQHRIQPFNLNIGADYFPYNNDFFQINANATMTLNTGNQISLETSSSFYTDSEPTLSISLGSKWFVDVPTSQRTSVGQVKGTLKRSNGQPVANTVIEISGARVVTQEDGSFNFPAIPAGQAFFRIPTDSLNEGEITNPPSPYVFDVVAQESHELNFEIVETASLQGKFIYDSNNERSTVQVNAAEKDIVSGLIIVLIHSDGTTVRREISNSSGEFKFLSLLPGEWSVTLSHSLADDDYKVVLENDSLQVAEGETANLNIVIEPIRRPIRFIDGGDVGSN